MTHLCCCFKSCLEDDIFSDDKYKGTKRQVIHDMRNAGISTAHLGGKRDANDTEALDKKKEKLKESLVDLKENHKEFKENHWKKWIVVAIGVCLGAILGKVVPLTINKLLNPLYSREKLDETMRDLLGKNYMDQALSDEVIMVAYDYNSQQPRLFSKYFS